MGYTKQLLIDIALCSETRLLWMVICIEMKSNEAAVSRYKACQKVKRNLKWQKRIGAMEKASDLHTSSSPYLHLQPLDTCYIKGKCCGMGEGMLRRHKTSTTWKNWWKWPENRFIFWKYPSPFITPLLFCTTKCSPLWKGSVQGVGTTQVLSGGLKSH